MLGGSCVSLQNIEEMIDNGFQNAFHSNQVSTLTTLRKLKHSIHTRGWRLIKNYWGKLIKNC